VVGRGEERNKPLLTKKFYVHPPKLIVIQLVKKFPVIYGTRKFIITADSHHDEYSDRSSGL
jgi:hypothetical protein